MVIGEQLFFKKTLNWKRNIGSFYTDESAMLEKTMIYFFDYLTSVDNNKSNAELNTVNYTTLKRFSKFVVLEFINSGLDLFSPDIRGIV